MGPESFDSRFVKITCPPIRVGEMEAVIAEVPHDTVARCTNLLLKKITVQSNHQRVTH